MALWIPSSARREQCILMGGRPSRESATSRFVMPQASSRVFPFASSVTMLEVAMAAAQPKVWNFMSSIRLSLIFRKIFMISPQTGFPTSPIPSASGISPMFRGWRKCSITFSVYICGISTTLPLEVRKEGRHGSEPVHDAGQHLEDIVHILLPVRVPEGELERPGGAGRTRGSTDAIFVQGEKHGLALDELDGDVQVPRKAFLLMTVQPGVRDLEDSLHEPVPHGLDLPVMPLDVHGRHLNGFSDSHDPCQVLGPGPPVVLLSPSVDQGIDPGPLADVEGTHALRTVELVTRKGEEVDVQAVHIDGDVPNRLDGIGMEGYVVFMGDGPELPHGFDGSDLVVREHDGDEDGILPHGGLEVGRVHETILVNGEIGDLKSFLLKPVTGVKDCVVLDLARDNVFSLLPVREGNPIERPVIRFAPPCCEVAFLRPCAEGLRHFSPCCIHCLSRLP